jgi:heme-degrading monooxygenase HmoA
MLAGRKEGPVISTCGVWVVKKGREADFRRRWEESSSALALEFPGVTFQLMRDRDDEQRYVSLGSGWRNLEQIEQARSLPAFQDAMASIWRLLESGDLSTLELAVEIS